MGYAGNIEPSYIVPTVIATNDAVDKKPGAKKVTIDDLDFHIGDEATKANATGYSLSYPIRHGQAPCYAGPAEPSSGREHGTPSRSCAGRQLGPYGEVLAAVHLQVPSM